MPFANYVELQAEILDELVRPELTSEVVGRIALAESEINCDFRARLAEIDSPLTLLAGARTVALPARFIEPRSLSIAIAGQDREQITPRLPEQLRIQPATSARPQYWAINGDSIEFECLADQNYPLVLRMVQGLDIASTGTNAVLTAYPGLYLYGALLHFAPWLANDERLMIWKALYDSVLSKALRKEARAQALPGLVTDIPTSRQSRGTFLSN